MARGVSSVVVFASILPVTVAPSGVVGGGPVRVSVTVFVSLPQPARTRATRIAAQASRGMGATLHQSRKRAQGSDNGPILPMCGPMGWLKHLLTLGLLLAATAVVVATAFSSHSGDYGKVALPAGGVVHLPKGTVTVYEPEGRVGIDFEITTVAGGAPLPIKSAGGTIEANGVQRSEVVGEHGAVAKGAVPAGGDDGVGSTKEVDGTPP